jgi:hypothetical protein
MTYRRVLAGVLPLLLAGTASHAAAQQPPEVDGRLIPSAVDTFNVSYGGHVIGRGITEWSRVDTADGVLLLQVYTWRSAADDAVIVDSLFSDERSLRSVREVRVLGDTVIEARWSPDAIRVSRRVAGEETADTSVPVRGAVFSSAVLELIVASGPLQPGRVADVHLYYAPPAPLGIQRLRIEVRGRERVADRTGAERDAWVVHATTPGGGTTYWIDPEDRTVLRYDTREGEALIEFRR